jgi:tetratricopeptide (TPR) repeat protein
MKKSLLSTILLASVAVIYFHPAYSQEKHPLSRVQTLADSNYKAKNYLQATAYYAELAERNDFKGKIASAYYNMACCLSLQGKRDSAMVILNKAVEAGYANKANMLDDTDLLNLHKLPQWNTMVSSLKASKKVLNDDPAKARFITTDIHHFWAAYDAAQKDTAHFRQIMKALYFDRSSAGMDDYMAAKVSSIDFFIQHIRSAPNFYAAIRRNTLKTDEFKPKFLASFKKMKSIYSAAKFPDVYFMIGAFTSGGTATDLGLLLGVNQVAADSQVPLEELSFRQRTRMNNIDVLPDLLGHELIHYQQDGMKNDPPR